MRSLLAGLAVVVPIALVIIVGWQLLGLLTGLLGTVTAVLGRVGITGFAAQAVAAVVGIGGLLLGLLVLGAVVRNRVGRLVVARLDVTIEHVPLLGPIYRGLRRAREIILQGGDDQFRRVVLVALTDDIHALGFVVGDTRADLQDALEGDQTAVYLPLAPNPTVGGHMLVVSPSRIIETSLSFQEALAALVTLGSSADSSFDTTTTPLAGLYHEPPADDTQ